MDHRFDALADLVRVQLARAMAHPHGWSLDESERAIAAFGHIIEALSTAEQMRAAAVEERDHEVTARLVAEERARVVGEALRKTLKTREPVPLTNAVADGPDWKEIPAGWMCIDSAEEGDTAAAIHHADGCTYERDVALLASLPAAPAEEPAK